MHLFKHRGSCKTLSRTLLSHDKHIYRTQRLSHALTPEQVAAAKSQPSIRLDANNFVYKVTTTKAGNKWIEISFTRLKKLPPLLYEFESVY